MIRLVLMLFGVAVALCVLIILRPFSADPAPAAAEVTRAADGFALPQGAAAAIAQAIPDVPAGAVAVDGTDLATTTAAILADLGVAVAAPAGPDDPLAAMTLDALGAIRQATGVALPPGAAALQALVARSLREGQSDAVIDARVNEAARRGEVSVPAMLVTAGGRVDTAVLLASIIGAAQSAGGQPPRAVAPLRDPVVHVVAEGDSLGALALHYYGDAARYRLIFDANRTLLTRPDAIGVGQRLVIPELPDA